MTATKQTQLHHVAASQIIIIPRDKRRYRIAPAHCPVTVTANELILHTDGPSVLDGVEWFLLDNMRERDALRVLAGLDEQ